MDPVRNPYAPGAGQRPPELAGRDRELDAFEARKKLFVEAGQVPEDLAARVAVLHPAYQLLFILEIADREGPLTVTYLVEGPDAWRLELTRA